MMRRSFIALGLASACALSACSTAFKNAASPAYPMLDGNCVEYSNLGATAQALPHDVTLFVFQDPSYVWLCAAFPPDSIGTADIVMHAPALETPLNLHVSAQIGEWPMNDPDAAPQTPESDRWWKVSGWFANAARMNGYVDSEHGRRADFLPAEGREFQLDKEKFGRGEWRMKFELRAVRGRDGEYKTIDYPADDDDYFLLVVN